MILSGQKVLPTPLFLSGHSAGCNNMIPALMTHEPDGWVHQCRPWPFGWYGPFRCCCPQPWWILLHVTSAVKAAGHCCSDPAGRLTLSMFSLHACIKFLISLQLSLPWGASRWLLNWLSLIFRCHHRWVQIKGSGMAKVCQQIGLIWQQATCLVVTDSILGLMTKAYLGCRVICVHGEIYSTFSLSVWCCSHTYLGRAHWISTLSWPVSYCNIYDIQYGGSADKEGQSQSRTLSCMTDGNGGIGIPILWMYVRYTIGSFEGHTLTRLHQA